MKRVVIVGGGIAGLSTAYYLQKQAQDSRQRVEGTLVEGAPSLGGKIATRQRDGFVIEGGPDSFITQKPWALELCHELGLSDRLIGTNDEQRQIYVLNQSQLVPLPEGVMLVVPTRFWPFVTSPLISWPGKVRMGMDFFIQPRREDGDESLGAFIRRRLGQEALEKIAEPLMAGIHVADPEQLSLQATFPRFAEIERRYGSLIRGMLAARRQVATARTQNNGRSSGPTSAFVTLRGGLRELVDALTARLQSPTQLIAGRRVVSLTQVESGYSLRLDDGTPLESDAVVLATPAYISADLVEEARPELAQALRQLRYVSTATVSLAFRRSDVSHPLDGFGFIIPTSEGRKIIACTWTSTKFGGRAPACHALLRAFVGGVRHEPLVELDDDEMVWMVRNELRSIMGITAEPLWAEIFRWRKSNPQYAVGHLDWVARVESLCPDGLFLAGSAYRGVGLPDCIHSGQMAAEGVVEWVAR